MTKNDKIRTHWVKSIDSAKQIIKHHLRLHIAKVSIPHQSECGDENALVNIPLIPNLFFI